MRRTYLPLAGLTALLLALTVTVPLGPSAVRWARQEGARVISCSVIMPSWSDGQGGGAMHRALTALLGSGTSAADLLCFASAGNTTERHWAGHFHDRGDGWHCWQAQQID